MKIKANDISMNYQIKGTGVNLVLIHGAGDNLNMWYHQLPVFLKSYRVITYDIRESGKDWCWCPYHWQPDAQLVKWYPTYSSAESN